MISQVTDPASAALDDKSVDIATVTTVCNPFTLHLIVVHSPDTEH